MISLSLCQSFLRSNSSFFLCNGNASQSSVLRLRFKEDRFLVDAGPGAPRISMQDELTGVPSKGATWFENQVGSRRNVAAGDSPINKRIFEYISLVAGQSLNNERAATRIHPSVAGALDVAAGDPLLLPRRFRQNRAWMELKNLWRTRKRVRGFLINKVRGGYSVAIAGFITFLPFSPLINQRIANDRFTIDNMNPKRRKIVVWSSNSGRSKKNLMRQSKREREVGQSSTLNPFFS